MQAIKLSKNQIRELHSHLAQDALINYELMWVLESCFETPASTVYGLGSFPWSAGILITHRQCFWLWLKNERFLETLLSPLPKQDMYRFYTSEHETLDMLQRWFPHGQLSQSKLCVRNLTKSWRKRFDISIEVSENPATLGGQSFTGTDKDGRLIASAFSQQAVLPWHEIFDWEIHFQQDISYWTEQFFGAITSALLDEGFPVIVRVQDNVLNLLEPLGYRQFCELYYYVAAGE